MKKKQKSENSSPYTDPYYYLDGFNNSEVSLDEKELPRRKSKRIEGQKNASAKSTSRKLNRYTDQEEEKFLKGIELFGEDFAQISKYIGTRDTKSVQAHAKIYYAHKNHLKKNYTKLNSISPQLSQNSLEIRKSSRRKALKSYVLSSQKHFFLTLCKCDPYTSGPSSNQVDSQPFSLKVSINALVVADLHAHLLSCEIIGFLAGKWNRESKSLQVIAAYPCKEITSSKNSVEMDPISELEVRTAIQRDNLVVVGWYHSHPTFEPDPSLIDIENQNNYQLLFCDEKSRIDPFVGLIIGPYDPRLPIGGVINNWFHVSFENGQPVPRKLVPEIDDSLKIDTRISQQCCSLYDALITHRFSLKLDDYWKKGLEQSRVEKLIQSVFYLLSKRNQSDILSCVAECTEPAFMNGDELRKQSDFLTEESKHVFDFILTHLFPLSE